MLSLLNLSAAPSYSPVLPGLPGAGEQALGGPGSASFAEQFQRLLQQDTGSSTVVPLKVARPKRQVLPLTNEAFPVTATLADPGLARLPAVMPPKADLASVKTLGAEGTLQGATLRQMPLTVGETVAETGAATGTVAALDPAAVSAEHGLSVAPSHTTEPQEVVADLHSPPGLEGPAPGAKLSAAGVAAQPAPALATEVSPLSLSPTGLGHAFPAEVSQAWTQAPVAPGGELAAPSAVALPVALTLTGPLPSVSSLPSPASMGPPAAASVLTPPLASAGPMLRVLDAKPAIDIQAGMPSKPQARSQVSPVSTTMTGGAADHAPAELIDAMASLPRDSLASAERMQALLGHAGQDTGIARADVSVSVPLGTPLAWDARALRVDLASVPPTIANEVFAAESARASGDVADEGPWLSQPRETDGLQLDLRLDGAGRALVVVRTDNDALGQSLRDSTDQLQEAMDDFGLRVEVDIRQGGDRSESAFSHRRQSFNVPQVEQTFRSEPSSLAAPAVHQRAQVDGPFISVYA